MGMKFRPLNADEIEVRVGSQGDRTSTLLLYIKAGAIMNLLDESVGVENWQTTYEVVGGNLCCNLSIRVIRENDTAEWVVKQDVGTAGNVEKEKGSFSDAFKRAAKCWGIGRELRTAPKIWVYNDNPNLEKDRQGRIEGSKIDVSSVTVENNRITAITLVNSQGKQIFQYPYSKAVKSPQQTASQNASQKDSQPAAGPQTPPEQNARRNNNNTAEKPAQAAVEQQEKNSKMTSSSGAKTTEKSLYPTNDGEPETIKLIPRAKPAVNAQGEVFMDVSEIGNDTDYMLCIYTPVVKELKNQPSKNGKTYASRYDDLTKGWYVAGADNSKRAINLVCRRNDVSRTLELVNA